MLLERTKKERDRPPRGEDPKQPAEQKGNSILADVIGSVSAGPTQDLFRDAGGEGATDLADQADEVRLGDHAYRSPGPEA